MTCSKAGLDSLGALELGAALAGAGFGDFDPPRLLEARIRLAVSSGCSGTKASPLAQPS